MGYWDKKESKKEETVTPVADSTEALDKFEKDAANYIKDSTGYLSRQIKDMQKRMQALTSDGYWFAVYFNNDTQKQECLDKLGFNQFDKYINGREFMKAIKKSMESPDFDFGEERVPVKEFAERALPVNEQK